MAVLKFSPGCHGTPWPMGQDLEELTLAVIDRGHGSDTLPDMKGRCEPQESTETSIKLAPAGCYDCIGYVQLIVS